MAALRRSAICWAVEKSPTRMFRVSLSCWLNSKGMPRSTMPPPGIRPTVLTFFWVLAAAPVTEKPPTVNEPWARQ